MKDRVFGTIIRIRGPVIDIRFAEGEEPKINSLVSTENGNFHMEVRRIYPPERFAALR